MTLTVQISQISMSMDINNIIDVFTTTLVKKAQLLIPSIKITNRKLVHWQTKKKNVQMQSGDDKNFCEI